MKTNELNKDQVNASNDDDNAITIDTQAEPISFRECIKMTNQNHSYELYSSCLSCDQLAEILLQLHHELKGEPKSSPSYI